MNTYRIWCTSDEKYEYINAETEPTVCPVDSGHGIDAANIAITEEDI